MGWVFADELTSRDVRAITFAVALGDMRQTWEGRKKGRTIDLTKPIAAEDVPKVCAFMKKLLKHLPVDEPGAIEMRRWLEEHGGDDGP